MKKQKIIVLGGGPCGLYAARTLSRHGHDVVVLDKGERPGGLATSMHYNGNWYDLGVHMFHAFDKEIFEDVKTLMGDERVEVDLNARIKWAGGSYRYPLQFMDMIKGIPIFKLSKQVVGLFSSQLYNLMFPYQATNAEQALIQLYGKPLYKFFFEDFTHRYWDLHPTQLSATFITTKMPKLSAVDVVKKGLEKVGIKSKTQSVDSALTRETLHYSRTGAETMTRCVAKAIVDAGSDVILNAEVTQLITDGSKVTSVIYRKDNVDHELACDACISTLPINALIRAMQPSVPATVLQAVNNLRYKPIVVVGLLVKKQRCIDSLYVYYRNHVFHRVGEPKNGGLVVNPSDHTVLIIEMTCEIGDAKWHVEESVKKAIYKDLATEGICKKEDIVEFHVSRYETGYPVFALGFEKDLGCANEHVKGFSNLRTTGRQGAFTYPNMHKAMRMGQDTAENLMKSLEV